MRAGPLVRGRRTSPLGLQTPVQVWQEYKAFIRELVAHFPHEEAGIRGFYGDAWSIFNALNSIELKSLEEPRYLMQQLARSPIGCLRLATWLTTNTGGWGQNTAAYVALP